MFGSKVPMHRMLASDSWERCKVKANCKHLARLYDSSFKVNAILSATPDSNILVCFCNNTMHGA